MTRRGSPEEQEWRRDRSDDPGLDGSLHNTMPVPPRGRRPREKPQGHKHEEPQPPEVHGSEAHEGETITEHGSGSHDTTVADNPHDSTAHSEAYATSPHGDEAHSKQTVENLVGSPSRSRNTRANQPAPSNVGVGSEYRVEDEGDVLEIATDTDDDGVADSWAEPSATHGHPGLADDPHDDAQHSRDYDADFVNVGGDTMTGRLDIDRGGIGEVRITHGSDPTWNYGAITVIDDSGSNTQLFVFGPDDANNPDTVRVTSGTLQVGTNSVWHEGNFDPIAKADTPHGDGAHSRDYDADFVNESGDTMSGPLLNDQGGVGFLRLAGPNGTNNISGLRTEDDAGNTGVNYLQYGPAESEPRHEFRGDALVDGNLAVARDGIGRTRIVPFNDASRNLASIKTDDDSGSTTEYVQYGPAESDPRHEFRERVQVNDSLTADGTITSGGTVRSDRSGIGSLFLRHTNDGSRNNGDLSITDGSGNTTSLILYGPDDTGDPGARIARGGASIDLFFEESAAGPIPLIHVPTGAGDFLQVGAKDSGGNLTGIDFRTDDRSSDPGRITPMVDSVWIAHFMEGPPAHIAPGNDGAADLGKSASRWDNLYVNTVNESSDPRLKRDMQPVEATDAARRVQDTAKAAISYKALGGERTHLGFNADLVGQAHGDESAVFVDPDVNGDHSAAPGSGEPRKSLRHSQLLTDLYVATDDILRRLQEAGL